MLRRAQLCLLGSSNVSRFFSRQLRWVLWRQAAPWCLFAFSILEVITLNTACQFKKDSGILSDLPPSVPEGERPSSVSASRLDPFAGEGLGPLLREGVAKGGSKIEKAAKKITKAGEWDAAESRLGAIFAFPEQYSEAELNNALGLLRFSNATGTPILFRDLVHSDSATVRVVAWRVAAARPTLEMAAMIRPQLLASVYPSGNGERGVFLPEIADAVRLCKMQDTYTYLRQGLKETGLPAFVKAMATLVPDQAAGDFMTYLGQAPADDLEKGDLRQIEGGMAIQMLKHLETNLPDRHHPNFGYLFLFEGLPNKDLSSSARLVLRKAAALDPDGVLGMLGKMPPQVQQEFARRIFAEKGPVDDPLLVMLRQAPTMAPLVRAFQAGKKH